MRRNIGSSSENASPIDDMTNPHPPPQNDTKPAPAPITAQGGPSAAAMRAAAAITGGLSEKEWENGLARIIDRETGLPELIAALEAVVRAADRETIVSGKYTRSEGEALIKQARAAIARATKPAV
jgi:hypothetical protein